MTFRVAMLSVHTCPLAAPGGKETGGMNVYVRELSRELGRMGVMVDVFTRSQNPAIPRVVSMGEGVRVVHLPAGREAPIEREKVHEHLEEFVEGIERWRQHEGAEYHVVHAHYWLSGVAALELRRRWSVPILQMFHTLGRLKNQAVKRKADLEPDIRVREERRVISAVDRIVAANVVEQAQLVWHYATSPGRIVVIPCGVDTDVFRPAPSSSARHALGLDGGPIVLYVGRIAPIKGLDTLLDALARLRQRATKALLLIVGGDADEPPDGHEAYLRRRIEALGLGDAVRFIGPQPQEALTSYYTAADVTVLPSYYESFGMVALEAMACGRPVIASRVGGLTTTVREGVTGFLFPEGDVTALADRLERLLADDDLRASVGREGVHWAEQHRWPCVAEAVCREYGRLQPRASRYVERARCRG